MALHTHTQQADNSQGRFLAETPDRVRNTKQQTMKALHPRNAVTRNILVDVPSK